MSESSVLTKTSATGTPVARHDHPAPVLGGLIAVGTTALAQFGFGYGDTGAAVPIVNWPLYWGGVAVVVLALLPATAPGQYVVSAMVWRDAGDEHPAATGLAEERVAASGINASSALENAETSAIGRAPR